MEQWVDITERFSEEERHYKNVYLEICEVYNDDIEVNLYSSKDDPYEIYLSFGIMYGIIYAKKEEAYELREQIKKEIIEEYEKNGEPSSEFINLFEEKYKISIPADTLFDIDMMKLFELF